MGLEPFDFIRYDKMNNFFKQNSVRIPEKRLSSLSTS